MKLEDIIALAKQGYKKKDIEELINMAEKETEVEEKSNVPEVQDEQDAEPEKGHEEPETVPDEPDYKKLYEESQIQIKALQQKNITKNISANEPSNDEILQDIVRSFM